MDDNLVDAMLGFTIRVERQGNEYATEAERGVLTGYFEHRGLHQMSDEADVRHLNSIRLLEKNGFQLKERQQAEVGDVDRAASTTRSTRSPWQRGWSRSG